MLSLHTQDFRAIICDLDGTLSDTETLFGDVLITTCKNYYNIAVSKEEVLQNMGLSTEDFFLKVFASHNLQYSADEARKRQAHEYHRRLRAEARFMPGANDFILMLKKTRLPLGLVSGSSRKEIGIILKKLEITDLFTTVVSCKELQRRKPDPEGYLLAAKLLNAPPQNCLVFEDTRWGVQAAKNAGMFCVGVQHIKDQDLSSADVRLNNLLEFVFE
ncbi:MAG: HAD family phosphatase [Candidatus Peribacteraceae bacterium]|nr:HAD family phosphatase [Candidatus Peribacteraceae bacterium]